MSMLEVVVQSTLEQYLQDEFEETPDDVIEASFREAWHEARSGKGGRPAREVLDEIPRELT